MTKTLKRVAISVAIALALPLSALAQTSTSTDVQALINQLQTQIEALQTQIEALKEAQQRLRETAGQVHETLVLLQNLREGMTGEQVTLLQQILATDPAIYPEGLVTGYFGALTAAAVRKFQAAANIEQVGEVGPKTRAKLNELLSVGAGASGKVPPGLLIAPGIRSKLGYVPQPLPGQNLPKGIKDKFGQLTGGDTVAPVVLNITGSTTASTTSVTWSTNEPAKGALYHSTSTPINFGSSTPMLADSLALNHSAVITGLTASTTYYVAVVATDAAGNMATSSTVSFTTAP